MTRMPISTGQVWILIQIIGRIPLERTLPFVDSLPTSMGTPVEGPTTMGLEDDARLTPHRSLLGGSGIAKALHHCYFN